MIVGSVQGATIPEWHVSGKAVWPSKYWDMFRSKSGQQFPAELIMKGKNENIPRVKRKTVLLTGTTNVVCVAAQELDGFAKILEAEGVIVRRPDVGPGDFGQSYETPDFKV